jgi:DNA-binding MarR family transcriptional regulator
MSGNRGPDPSVEYSDVIEAMQLNEFPAVIASDLEEDLPVGKGRILDLLNEMENEGYVKRKQAGANAVVWAPTDKGLSLL